MRVTNSTRNVFIGKAHELVESLNLNEHYDYLILKAVIAFWENGIDTTKILFRIPKNFI